MRRPELFSRPGRKRTLENCSPSCTPSSLYPFPSLSYPPLTSRRLLPGGLFQTLHFSVATARARRVSLSGLVERNVRGLFGSSMTRSRRLLRFFGLFAVEPVGVVVSNGSIEGHFIRPLEIHRLRHRGGCFAFSRA